MSDKPRLHPRLHQLLDAACDGLLTAEQTAELETILRADREAWRLYREYCQLHVDLHFLLCGDRVREAVQAELEPPPPYLFLTADETPSTETLPTDLFGRVFLAMGLLVGVLLLGVWIWGGPAPAVEVARLTDVFEAQWADAAQTPSTEAALLAGQTLELRSGFATLRFVNGAEVLLEGPATFRLESVAAGWLGRGKLVGRVKTARAHGFTIHTPTVTVIDQGTEFGLAVDEVGHTEAHVFKGKVETRLMANGRAAGDILRVDAGQAVCVDQGTGRLTRMVPRTDAFVRTIPDAPAEYTRTVLATQPDSLWAYWRLEEYPVALRGAPTVARNAAVTGTRNDALWGGKDLVPRCVPLSGLAGPRPQDGFLGLHADNRAAQFTGMREEDGADMLQVGSIWLKGREAADRTLDVETQTIAFFLKTSQNATDSRLYVAHPDNEHDFQIVMSEGRLGVTTLDDSTAQTVMTAAHYNDDQWHHVVVVRNGDLAVNARLNVDGQLVPMAAVERSFNAGGTSRFGTRSSASAWWIGLLDEIAVWNTSLTEAEIEALYQTARRGGAADGKPSHAQPSVSDPDGG